jgi:8-oxo-dGTP pyrophosphatase MutT (NUDIX family)
MTLAPRLFVVSSRGKWTSAGGIVVDRGGRLALVRERGKSGWTLPKGRLESRESLEEAALREVLEETGIRARIAGYVGVYEGRRSFVHYFLMDLIRIDGKPDDDEIDELRMVHPGRAVDMVRSRRDRAAIAAVRTGAGRRALARP